MDYVAVFEIHDVLRIFPAVNRRLVFGTAATGCQHLQWRAVFALHLVHGHATPGHVVLVLLLHLHAQALGVGGRGQQQWHGCQCKGCGDQTGSDAFHGLGFPRAPRAPMCLCSKNSLNAPENAITKKAACAAIWNRLSKRRWLEVRSRSSRPWMA